MCCFISVDCIVHAAGSVHTVCVVACSYIRLKCTYIAFALNVHIQLIETLLRYLSSVEK